MIGKALEHLWVFHGLEQRFIDAVDGGRWRACFCNCAKPHASVDAGNTQFGKRGHIWHLGCTLVGGNGQGLELFASNQRRCADDGVEHEVDLAAHHVLQSRGRSFVGHMVEGATGFGTEGFAQQMANRAHALRCKVEPALASLGLRHQIADAGQWAVDAHDHHQRRRDQRGNGCEVLDRVVGEMTKQRGVDGEHLGRAHIDGVTVGRLLAYIGSCNLPAATGLVIHHDRLAQLLTDLECQNARDSIGNAPGRKWNDHGHGPTGEAGLCPGRRGSCGEGESGKAQQIASIPHAIVSVD